MPAYYAANGEPVWVIFDGGQSYIICSENRGAERGGPVYAGKDHRTNVSYFD